MKIYLSVLAILCLGVLVATLPTPEDPSDPTTTGAPAPEDSTTTGTTGAEGTILTDKPAIEVLFTSSKCPGDDTECKEKCDADAKAYKIPSEPGLGHCSGEGQTCSCKAVDL